MDIRTFSAIIATGFFESIFLYQLLHYFSLKRPIPGNVAELYDRRVYQRWRRCQIQLVKFRMASIAGGLLLALLLICTNAISLFYPDPADAVPAKIGKALLTACLISGCIILFVGERRIRKKYGFDPAKGDSVTLIILAAFGISFLLYILMETLTKGLESHNETSNAWAWIIIVISAFVCLALPVMEQHLFNKRLFSLKEGELYDRFQKLIRSSGLRNLRVCVNWHDSGRINASLRGFPSGRTVVLNNSLLQALNEEEVNAVFMHEVGHVIHHAMLCRAVEQLVSKGGIPLIAWGMIQLVFFAKTMRPDKHPIPVYLMIAGFFLLWPAFLMIRNWFRHRAELKADIYATEAGLGQPLIGALKAMEKQEITMPNPLPFFSLLTAQHPPLTRRIANIEDHMRGK